MLLVHNVGLVVAPLQESVQRLVLDHQIFDGSVLLQFLPLRLELDALFFARLPDQVHVGVDVADVLAIVPQELDASPFLATTTIAAAADLNSCTTLWPL